jgi:hypothetical protein
MGDYGVAPHLRVCETYVLLELIIGFEFGREGVTRVLQRIINYLPIIERNFY